MKPQAVAVVLFAASFFAIGASIERSTHHPSANAGHAAVKPRPAAPQRIAEVVTLPEVTVRPSADDIALANAVPVAAYGVEVGPVPVRQSVGGPRLSFDMPYYSFGKVLPQVSRE